MKINKLKQRTNQITITLLSPLNGKVIPLKDVNDPTFSEAILGTGTAIIPNNGVLTAPADGTVDTIPETKHAVMMTSDLGAEILMHIGIDTVELGGRHFRAFVSPGDRVNAGDPLIEFEPDAIKKEGYDTTTPVIITNSEKFCEIKELVTEAIEKQPLMELIYEKNS